MLWRRQIFFKISRFLGRLWKSITESFKVGYKNVLQEGESALVLKIEQMLSGCFWPYFAVILRVKFHIQQQHWHKTFPFFCIWRYVMFSFSFHFPTLNYMFFSYSSLIKKSPTAFPLLISSYSALLLFCFDTINCGVRLWTELRANKLLFCGRFDQIWKFSWGGPVPRSSSQ